MSIGPLLQRLVANMQLAGRVLAAPAAGGGGQGRDNRGLLSITGAHRDDAKGGQAPLGREHELEGGRLPVRAGRVGVRQLGMPGRHAMQHLEGKTGAGDAAKAPERRLPKMFMFSG